MKYALLVLGMLSGVISPGTSYCQDGDTLAKPETFQMEWRDSTVTMQKYFVVFLKRGATRNQSEEEGQKIQQAHLTYLSRMYDEGYVSMTGPFGDDGEIRGIVIYHTATLEKARTLAEGDPAVRAGRLRVEVHPWWAAKGSHLH